MKKKGIHIKIYNKRPPTGHSVEDTSEFLKGPPIPRMGTWGSHPLIVESVGASPLPL